MCGDVWYRPCLTLVGGEHRLLTLPRRGEEVRLAPEESKVEIQHEVDGVLSVSHGRHLLRHLQHHGVEALSDAVVEWHCGACVGVGAAGDLLFGCSGCRGTTRWGAVRGALRKKGWCLPGE